MLKRLFILIVTLFYISALQGQDLHKDLISFYEQASAAQEIQMIIETFDKEENKTEVQKMTMSSGKDYFFSRNNEIDYLFAEDTYIMIHHKEKAILVREHQESEFGKKPLLEAFTDSILTKMKDIQFKGISKGNKNYQATSVSGRFKKIEIELDAATNFPKRLVYWYASEDPKKQVGMVIKYKQTKELNNQLFKISNYVLQSGKTLDVKQAYKNYELINLNRQ